MKQTDIAQGPILLVDDDPQTLRTVKLMLESHGMAEVETLTDARQVVPSLASLSAGVIILDYHMPNLTGGQLLQVLSRDFPHIPVIMLTSSDEVSVAVECMKSGACDYLVKPVEPTRLVSTVQKALERNVLSHELSCLKQRLLSDQLENPEAFAALITGNRKMRAVFQYLEVVAATRQPVLITGETGVGKELVARAVHTLSGCKGEFTAINVAGLDDHMFSDTLFGHKKGAFTGADQARDGLIARAAGGTLFLDEIGDLNEMSQIKLLRLLQEREYYPVGSDTPRMSDARIVLATNRDLKKLIDSGRFRNDLYYRLCAHQVAIPPLRERLDDIPLLLDHFLTTAAAEFNKKKPSVPAELHTLLSLYPYPGNIREMQAMVFDAVARHVSGVLSMESFRRVIGDERPAIGAAALPVAEENPLVAIFGHFPTIREVEDYMLAKAMSMANGNQGIAASLLGIARQTLNKRLQVNDRQE